MEELVEVADAVADDVAVAVAIGTGGGTATWMGRAESMPTEARLIEVPSDAARPTSFFKSRMTSDITTPDKALRSDAPGPLLLSAAATTDDAEAAAVPMPTMIV